MNRKKYIILTLILSLLSINKVYASCTQEELNEFKNIEDQYKITYEFNKATKNYTITIKNKNPQKYDFGYDNKIDANKIINDDPSNIIINNLEVGEYNFLIFANSGCEENIKNINIILPEYNIYAYDPLCEDLEEFYLCNPQYQKKVDRKTFESRINTYKNTKLKEEKEPSDKKEEKQKINKMVTYIKNNITQIIIITIFVILVIITTIVTINSTRKSRRLE